MGNPDIHKKTGKCWNFLFKGRSSQSHFFFVLFFYCRWDCQKREQIEQTFQWGGVRVPKLGKIPTFSRFFFLGGGWEVEEVSLTIWTTWYMCFASSERRSPMQRTEAKNAPCKRESFLLRTRTPATPGFALQVFVGADLLQQKLVSSWLWCWRMESLDGLFGWLWWWDQKQEQVSIGFRFLLLFLL